MAKVNPKLSKSHCWLVAYVDSSYIGTVERDLLRMPEYKDIEVYIPTVRILRKTFKKENFFEEVPLLFNYGFFKVPRKFAVYQSYLDNMKSNIRCIFAWVKDPVKVITTKTTSRDGELLYDRDSDIPIATATAEEIFELENAAYYSTLHDQSEVDKLLPGQVIKLRGYPFDEMWAEVVEILPKRRQVKVLIQILDAKRPAVVSFDNIFFTVYHNKAYDDTLSLQQSLDDMSDKRTLDKAMFKNQRNDE